MTLFLKKYWWALIGLAIVVFILFRGCKAGPSHAGDKSTLDSLNAADGARAKILTTKIDSLAGVVRVKDRVIDSLMIVKNATEITLRVRGQQLNVTIAALDAARQHRDTVGTLANCDTLEQQVVSDRAIIEGYEATTDTLINQQRLASIAQDSISNNWKSLFLMSDSARVITMTKYNSLYSDYNKVNTKLKFSGFMGKVGAVVIAGLAVGLLIKK